MEFGWPAGLVTAVLLLNPTGCLAQSTPATPAEPASQTSFNSQNDFLQRSQGEPPPVSFRFESAIQSQGSPTTAAPAGVTLGRLLVEESVEEAGPHGSPAPSRLLPKREEYFASSPAEVNSFTVEFPTIFGVLESFHRSHDFQPIAARIGLNWGSPVIDDNHGWGAQIGGAAATTDDDWQFFFTMGPFFRTDASDGTSWGIGAVFDLLGESDLYWADGDIRDRYLFTLMQLRAKTSLILWSFHELGVWGAKSLPGDSETNGGPFGLANQANVFYRHFSPNNRDVTAWAGWRSDPDSVAIGLDASFALHDDCSAVVAGGHYDFAGSNWNIYLGLALYPGRYWRQPFLGEFRHMPYLPVADNTIMKLIHKDR